MFFAVFQILQNPGKHRNALFLFIVPLLDIPRTLFAFEIACKVEYKWLDRLIGLKSGPF